MEVSSDVGATNAAEKVDDAGRAADRWFRKGPIQYHAVAKISCRPVNFGFGEPSISLGEGAAHNKTPLADVHVVQQGTRRPPEDKSNLYISSHVFDVDCGRATLTAKWSQAHNMGAEV